MPHYCPGNVSDFRTRLYERYDSAFKKTAEVETEAGVRSYWGWCSHKILPLLDGVDRRAPLLELGCGAGYLLALLKERGFGDVLGIDVSQEQVELATRRGVEARCEDANAFLADNSRRYDAIVALDFVEHFTKDELLDMLPRICSALSDNGILILQTPNGEGLFPNQVVYGDLTHLTILNPGSLEQLLNVTGFGEVVFRETGPVPNSATGFVRKLLWSLIRGAATAVRVIETGRRQRIWTENMLCRCRCRRRACP